MKKDKIGNIYFDTNILLSLNFNIHEDPRLLTFQKSFFKTAIYVPKIVLDEVLTNRFTDILNKLTSAEDSIQRINRYVTTPIQLSVDAKNTLKEIKDNLIANIKKANIKVYDTPHQKIDLSKLIDMSIYKMRPFSEQGKGFKDAVILFSILEHCKQSKDEEHIFVTNNSKDFDNGDVKGIIEKEGVILTVLESIECLTSYLSEFMNEKVKKFLDKRAKQLKEYLITYKDVVMESVKRKDFESYYFTRDLGFWGNIEKIENVEFVDINNPVAGFLENSKDGDVDVTFNLKVRFDVIAKRTIYKSTKYKVGQLPTFSAIADPDYKYETNPLEKELRVKGKVYIGHKDNKEVFSDFRLEEVFHGDLNTLLMRAMENR